MTTRAIHEYLAEAMMKEVTVFGKDVGAERIRKCLAHWEGVYGSNVTSSARKLISSEWRKRFKAAGSAHPARSIDGPRADVGGGGDAPEKPNATAVVARGSSGRSR